MAICLLWITIWIDWFDPDPDSGLDKIIVHNENTWTRIQTSN